MFASIRSQVSSVLTFFALAVAATSAVGCAAEEPSTGAAVGNEEDVTSAREPGMRVNATWRNVVTGVPTYGYDATEPFASVEVVVDDPIVREKHPGFDGYERPFILLPRKDAAGVVRWERIDLPHTGGERYDDYYNYNTAKVRDLYQVKGVKLSATDLEAVLEFGIAVGMESNVGTIWAQDVGKNFIPTKAE